MPPDSCVPHSTKLAVGASVATLFLLFGIQATFAFAVVRQHGRHIAKTSLSFHHVMAPLAATGSESSNEDEEGPPLEFIDYTDPSYRFDTGLDDELPPALQDKLEQAGEDDAKRTSVEQEIEAMREERRRRNDEFQFQSYYSKILHGGQEFNGEWTIYRTSTFLPGVMSSADAFDGVPRLVKAARPVRMKSRGYKLQVENDSSHAVDGERICHEEGMMEASSTTYAKGTDPTAKPPSVSKEALQVQQEIIENKYWPDLLSSFDFRGQQGIMVCGNSYTICDAVALGGSSDPMKGPYAEYRAEIGVDASSMRFRVKFDYRILGKNDESNDDNFDSSSPPPLHLKSMTVCRELRSPSVDNNNIDEEAVSEIIESLYQGHEGASGGLYDPPPVGSDEQAANYMLLDLEGRATVLFPYRLEQDEKAFDGFGWCTSLDWTPPDGSMRYQVDRKVQAGARLRELRTLELSAVQPNDADTYRPKDGGRDMRQ